MLAQDIAVLLKLSLAEGDSPVLSKTLSDELFIAPADISKSLHRSKNSGLLYWSGKEKRVNRSALLQFLIHGLRYVFPPERGTLTRGIPTAASSDPLKKLFAPEVDPPQVWPYSEGTVRGLSFSPLYKGAPRAALLDPGLYKLLALCDAVRGGRTRERNLAIERLTKDLLHEDRPQPASS